MRHRGTVLLDLALIASLSACGTRDEAEAPASTEPTEALDMPEPGPSITANNAFFYYADLAGAVSFYEETLGLRRVADYGFAKIFQVASTSFVTLVDAASGMHSADEPKTVAMALITDELEEWYAYLTEIDVPMRSTELTLTEGGSHDGFVAIDPEGYFLEFERFNPHPENERFMPALDAARTHYSATMPELGIKATVLWLYYEDMEGLQRFWGDGMGLDQIVDQGWAKIYATSETGFIGLVDESRGMHSFTEDKGVTVSFLTDDLEGWYERLKGVEGFELRTPEILDEEGRVPVSVFVGYDPENYFLEFDRFKEAEANAELLGALDAGS